MIVVVPYTNLNQRVMPAIMRTWGGLVVPWRIDAADPYGYHRCLQTVGAMLTTGEDVAIVEHDVEPRTGSLASMERCGESYCFCPYNFSVPFDEAGLDYAPLGHTRFRASCAAAFGVALRKTFASPGYLDLDRILGHGLARVGIEPHRHPMSVIHHHRYPVGHGS